MHGDDFIITGDSLQLAWIESRLNEGLILKRREILGPGRRRRQDGQDPEWIGDLGLSFWIRSAPSSDLACADESGRCKREVSDDSNGEDAGVDAADAHED